MSIYKETYTVFAPYDPVVKLFLPIIPNWLKPNHLTFIRLLFTPVLIAWLVAQEYQVALIMFIVLVLTDLLDGSIARLRHQITQWGEIWDPIADKVLIGSTIAVLLISTNFALMILILAMEVGFILGGAFQKARIVDIDIKANIWGKIKMNFQGVGVGFLIFGFLMQLAWAIFVAQILLYISLIFAAVSLFKRGI